MMTVCFVYFKSLTLANLRAALYSVRRQDLSCVKEIVVIDNDTVDSVYDIQNVIDELVFPVHVRLLSFKHGDAARTHAWSSNVAVREAKTPWVLVTRADYVLDFSALKIMVQAIDYKSERWNGFVTGNGCHLHVDVAACERTSWHVGGTKTFNVFGGSTFDYTTIDAGVYLMRREAFVHVGGLNESLTAWGHAQTEFQYRLHKSGVEFVRIPETLFWHPVHGGEKDIDVAHRQLAGVGVDLKECWARYEGVSPYASL